MKKVSIFMLAAIFTLSLIGFIDATYLTVKHYTGEPVTCALLSGCEVVTSGSYSTFFGWPVALFGSLYYLAVFILAFAYVDFGRSKIMSVLCRFTVVGFLASIYFVYLQVFVIEQLCLYCLISAGTSTGLFLTGIYGIKKYSL